MRGNGDWDICTTTSLVKVARLFGIDQNMPPEPRTIDKHRHLGDNHPEKWLKSDYAVWGGEIDHSTEW